MALDINKIAQPINTFVHALKNSISNAKYYKNVIKAPTTFSVKYYLFLSFFLAGCMALNSAVRLSPTTKNNVLALTEHLKQTYPSELVITLNQGSLSTNGVEPLIFTLPIEGPDRSTDAVVIVDTKGTIDDLTSSNAFALINEKNMIIKEDENGDRLQVHSLQMFPDGVINKAAVENLADEAKTDVGIIPYAIFAVILVLTLIYFLVFRLVYLGFIALVTLIAFGKRGGFNLGASFRIAIHTVTIPLIIETLVSIVGLVIPLAGWFFVLHLMLIFVFVGKAVIKR